MYNPVEGGSVVEIQGIKCQLPPEGYGVNRKTGELEYIGVYKSSKHTTGQKWKRLTLPDNYEELLNEEKDEQEKQRKAAEAKGIKIKPEDEWTDSRLDKIREEHWRYRYCGFWFMNNGVPTYLTGTHWFYLNWCSSNTETGYMDYRSTDRELFYCVAHTDESPYAGGVIFVGRRQCGKTYMANAWMLDRISINKRKHGGIQSKTDKDAEKVFNKLVNSFVDLPDFFKPTFDLASGTRPKDTLRFFETNIKGKKSVSAKRGLELRSYIDFANNKSNFYDGDESMYAYTLDEFAKKQLNDIAVTWETVRPCIDKEGRWTGKAFVCSTIEDMDETGDGPLKLWQGSDIKKINDNNRTETGLYSIFFGAHESTFFDDYGNALIQKGIDFYNAERESKKNDSRALTAYKRKNPFTIEEAFRIESESCLFNAELINNQLDILSWRENIVERGNFVWENGVRDSKVIWQKDRNGRWRICWLFKEHGQSNNIQRIGNVFRPNNTNLFVAGADTFSHDIVEDGRRSDGAMLVKMKYNPNSNDEYSDAFVCMYLDRPEMATIQYEDMLKTAVYFGCQILFENQKNAWKDYFISRGYEAFLIKLKGLPDYGIPASKESHQKIAELTEEYVYENSKKVWFKELLKQWLKFNLVKTTPFDAAMAAGYTLIADNKISYNRVESKIRPLTDYFKKSKIA